MNLQKLSLTHLLILLISLSFLSSASQAATITVGDPLTLCSPLCDYSSVKTAVVNASAGDTIEIQPGVYAEGKIVIDKDLTLKSASTMAEIDGGGWAWVIKVKDDAVATLQNLRLQSAGSSSTNGTATLINHGTTRLRGVRVVGAANIQNIYGGIYNSAEALLILEEYSVVSGNRGINMGGGITNFGALVLRQATVYNNEGNLGGGIANLGGHVAVISSSLSGNHANSKGGAYASYSTTTSSMAFWGSSFSTNTADVDCDTYLDIDESPSCVN